MILKPVFDQLEFSNGLLITAKFNNKFGVYNREGVEIIPRVFDWLQMPRGSKKFIIAVSGYKYGVIDLSGKWIVPAIYEQIWAYVSNIKEEIFFYVKMDNKSGNS